MTSPATTGLKVPKSLLLELGIAHRVSVFSYERGDYAYLEEDCDATLFIEAYLDHYGRKPRFIEQHTDRSSRIRNYQHYGD